MKYHYITEGTCSKAIDIDIDDKGIINEVVIHGGCNGNTQGLCALVKGQRVDDVIARLKDIVCGQKGTSCPAQLAKALCEAINVAK